MSVPSRLLLAGCFIPALVFSVAVLGQQKTGKSPAPRDPRGPAPGFTSLTTGRGLVQILVTPGTENEARQYYTSIETELELELGDFSPGGTDRSTLDDLLKYVGHQQQDGKGIKAEDFELFDSEILMDLTKLKEAFKNAGRDPGELVEFKEGDVLVTRWFAPKITDVTLPEEFMQFGWRKLVRLKPLGESVAKKKNVGGMYLLFNVFANQAQLKAESPFKQRSNNNQVIFTRGEGSPALPQAAYFMVFGPLKVDPPKKAKPGEIILALNASFDYRHPEAVPPAQAYFVPKACAQCHGDEFGIVKAKLNYLDTDHWFDRVTAGDDFHFITQTKHGVLFDGGTDPKSDQFARAFEVVRKINAEVVAQNELADPGANGFSLRSAKNWSEIHKANVAHVGILDDLDKDGFLDRSILGERGIPGENDRWRKNDRVDEALLPLLNRYCYRCHSSVRYSTYDRSAVRLRSGETLQRFMQRYLSEPAPPDKPVVPFMPQDRVLPANVRTRIVGLLDRLID